MLLSELTTSHDGMIIGDTIEEVFDISSDMVDEVKEIVSMYGEDIHNLFKLSDGHGFAKQFTTNVALARMDIIPFWYHTDLVHGTWIGEGIKISEKNIASLASSVDFLDSHYVPVDTYSEIIKAEEWLAKNSKHMKKINEHVMIYITNEWIEKHNTEIINNSLNMLRWIFPQKHRAIDSLTREARDGRYATTGRRETSIVNNPNVFLRNYKRVKAVKNFVK